MSRSCYDRRIAMIPKFRAFHDGEIRYNASKVGNALYWDDGACLDLLAFKQETPAILMEYTTLRDINDVEICEDDNVIMFGTSLGKVVRHLGAFGYMWLGDIFIPFAANHNFDWVDGASTKIEVVGNVYEGNTDSLELPDLDGDGE